MITVAVTAAAGAALAFLLIPSVILFAEVVFSFVRRGSTGDSSPSEPRTTIVMPAHNEEGGIAATLANVVAQAGQGNRVLVVADNCTDATADVAALAGADVIQRSDATRRGKGYALDFAIRHLEADPPDVVVIMDADCTSADGAIRRLAAVCHKSQRPLQADYRLALPGGTDGPPSPYLLIAGFAFHLKNFIRPLGLLRLGLPCQLMGTGMAFPWPVIVKAPLATGDIVEDLALGLDLAKHGHGAFFYPQARVFSAFPENREGQTTQRSRWETGHLLTIAQTVPKLVMTALRSGNVPLLALALDAAVPPLAFFAMMLAAGLVATALFSFATGTISAFFIAALATLLFAASAVLAIWRSPDDVIRFGDLKHIPGYVLSKLALYAGVFKGHNVGWVRSKRDTE